MKQLQVNIHMKVNLSYMVILIVVTSLYYLYSQIANGELEWSKETCIGLYDSIADQQTKFSAFMERAFHAP
jgi:hypothetical protein